MATVGRKNGDIIEADTSFAELRDLKDVGISMVELLGNLINEFISFESKLRDLTNKSVRFRK